MEPLQRITAALDDFHSLNRDELDEICTVLESGLDKLEALDDKVARAVVCLDVLRTVLKHRAPTISTKDKAAHRASG
jgi:hypothetical protein